MPQRKGQVFRELTPRRREALEFLKEILADGKKSVIEIRARAEKRGIAPGSLAYCRKLLRVEITRDPQHGKFYWKLPF